ncbi:carbohydrate ABC transporter permease [Microbacterium sp. DT81.1]|uniref:carbohydrate ABC transporter permease n=1 Tax=Microbacterium sp. DT81.1 TaxID=3393413 RepID=UPI003CF0338A
MNDSPRRSERPTQPARITARRARLRDQLGSSLLLVPAIAYIGVFFAYPLVKNVVMSTQEYTTATFYTGEAPFVGFENYTAIFTSGLFGTFLTNTFVFVIGSIVGQFCIGLALAVFFSRRFPLNGIIRSLLLLPWLLPLVVSATLWRWMFDFDNGVVNEVITGLGLPAVPWLVSTQTAMIAVILVNIWIGIPFNMVILYGGIKEIPPELYEAARLDGASGRQMFRHITLPMLRPVIAVVLVLGFVYTVKVLDLVLVLTQGGPANSTQILATQAYKLSFENFNFGQGAAMGNVLILISLICGFIYLRINRASVTGEDR